MVETQAQAWRAGSGMVAWRALEMSLKDSLISAAQGMREKKGNASKLLKYLFQKFGQWYENSTVWNDGTQGKRGAWTI